jgi:lycopene beta-cyclase
VKPPEVEFVFAGGGLAGLSLACRLSRSPLGGRPMLIIDSDNKQCDDRTFSYWAQERGLFGAAICKSWDRLAFHAPGLDLTTRLGNYRYQTIRGLDFYHLARRELAGFPNIRFMQGRVERLEDTADGVAVHTGNQVIRARWAFDSRFPLPQSGSAGGRAFDLKLAFRGWEVETDAPVFDASTATLMDFRIPQKDDVRFFYVLPFDARHALVEFTLFTGRRVDAAACHAALEGYLRRRLGLVNGVGCRILPREGGSLPITDRAFPRKLGEHILAIGVHGGRLKPSTGYAFTRIQRDSQAIANSLARAGHPFDLPDESVLYRRLDSMMLEVMANHAGRIPAIFSALFKNNPIERIFRFLDEDASPAEVGRVMASLPPGLFLKILAQRGYALKSFRA